ncbi:SemiSWEET family sugar transporter [Cardinium endosymbiont of Oedothorax gibbosus]|uniref:SemiSWEET family sugar transporter n=1 Tax=Cardinium endosymbiont of Oedothorax gibbosus TaxID=931101 RepID=UPI002025217D|nr:SemiSWEET family transporter [Cardinium endosymbiont of Oedothorax gibbosus]
MDFCAISFLDVVSCIASSTAVLSLLPQIIQSYRTKSVHDVSMLMLLNLTVSSVSWTLYGAMTADKPLLLTNLLLTIGSLIMVWLKRKYCSAERP